MSLEHILHLGVALLGSAVVVIFLAARLRLPSLVALLLAGAAIGPTGLGWVADVHEVEAVAEIGVALLLFAIGLELSLEKLVALRRAFLVGGSLQAFLTLGVVALASRGFGLAWGPAVFVGSAVALSSTAIVLRLLDQRGETGTPQGNTTLGVLLFQDFLIVPLIVMAPVLAGSVPLSFGNLALRFGGALAGIGAVAFLARRAMPRLLHLLAGTRTREIFLLGGLAVCLGMAWLTHTLGFSLALGAFLAGLVISESEYSEQVFADVTPLRDLLASIFFLSVGMLVDLHFVAANLGLVAGIAAGVIVIKAVVAALAVAAVGYPARIRVLVGLGLAQIGEFSFVLMEVGRQQGLLVGDRHQALLAAAVVTMLATPGLFALAPRIAGQLAGVANPAKGAEEAELDGHVVIVGYGLGGQLMAKVLRETGLPYTVVELDPDRAREGRKRGEPIHFGDATQAEILLHAGAPRAALVVLALSDPDALRSAVSLARRIAPRAEIVVRARRLGEIEELYSRGADHVVAEEFETAIEIFTRVLRHFHIPGNVIRAQTRLLRGEHYAILRSSTVQGEVSEAVLDALSAGTSDIYRVGSGHPAVGRSLADLDLRRRSGATVLALVRGETSEANPSPEARLEAGDCLVLVGAHQHLDEAFQVLDEG